MSHRFSFTVHVETNRESGKFATRDEQADQIREAIEGADPSYLSGLGDYGDSEYTVDSWEVEDDDSEGTIKQLRKRVKDLEREVTKLSHGE